MPVYPNSPNPMFKEGLLCVRPPKGSFCPEGAPSLLGMWESPGIPSPESKGPRHQRWWLRLHVLSHMALRGGHSWSREGATPTQGSSASFLSGVPGFVLGPWPELTPPQKKKITALGQPRQQEIGCSQSPLLKLSGWGPTGEVKLPTPRSPQAGWGWGYVILLPIAKASPRIEETAAVSSAVPPQPANGQNSTPHTHTTGETA